MIKVEDGSRNLEVNSQSRTLRVIFWLLLFATCHLPLTIYSQPTSKQKKEQLQQQMKKLQEEIKTIQAAIKSTSAKKEKSLGEILSLQAKIKSRQKLITNISNQIGTLDESIART